MKSLIALSGFAAYCGFSYATRGITEVPEIHSFTDLKHEKESGKLKLMSLNIAHGRGSSFNHQLLMKRKKLKSNLDKISAVLKREQAHFCALQESDARTFYSNELHQSQYLARNSGMSTCIQGRHVNGMNFIYGTALLANRNIYDPLSIAFDFKAPNPTKGFVIASTKLAGEEIDIVSLHLDFMRKKLRHSQIKTLIEILHERKKLPIIMGDFNAEWNEKSPVRTLCSELNLKAWEPQKKLTTFPKLKKRLDWILIPKDFHFLSFNILKEKLSDHQAVTAEICI